MAQQLIVLQGTTWGIAWPITDTAGQPVDVTGWAVLAQVRHRPDSDTVLHEWSTELGTAVADEGGVTLTVAAAESSGWQWQFGVYDVELTDPGGRVARIAQGVIRVDPEVTRG